MSVSAVALLGEIAELQAGVGFPVDLQGRSSGDYPVAKVRDISRVGRSSEVVINAADHYIDERDLARLRARVIPRGSVLFAKIGEAIRQNHRVIAGCSLLIDNNSMAAIPTKRVESRYLCHYLRTIDFYSLASATTVPALRKRELERLSVPLPPVDEQERIAGILDAADALRAKRCEALRQLDFLLRSTFLDMFGDPVTNPLEWEVRELSRMNSKVQIGPFGSLLHKNDYVVDGVPLVNPMHIVGGEIQVGNEQTVSEQKAATLGNYRLQAGDVVMARRGEMGRCAIVSDCKAGMLCGTGSLFFRPHPDELTSHFLASTLSSEAMQRVLEGLSQGVTMPNLNRTMLEGLKVALPPLDLQGRFAAIVRSVERHKASQRAHLAELDTLFASLQARAFRGDL